MGARGRRRFRCVRRMDGGWDECLPVAFGDVGCGFGGGSGDLDAFAQVNVAGPQGGYAGGDDADADFPAEGRLVGMGGKG